MAHAEDAALFGSEWRPYLLLYLCISAIGLLALPLVLAQRFAQRRQVLAMQRSHFLAEAAPEGMVMLSPQGEILAANPAGRRLLGLGERFSGVYLQDLLAEHASLGHNEPVEEWLCNGSAVTVLHPDGSYPARLSVLRLAASGPAHYGAFLHDIRQRDKLEKEQRALMEKLIAANSELENFTFVAAHDLQEPLRLITGFASVLRQRYGEKLDERGRELLRMLSEASQRMQELVADLYQYTQTSGDNDVLSLIDSREPCHQAEANLKQAIEESQAVISIGSLPAVYANASRFTVLMQNILDNAIKYRRAEVAPRIAVEAQDYGQMWLFSVSDNGIGMEECYHSQIFEPFKRLHSATQYKGSGIGLAICRKIVQRHGGEIWVESKPGEGSKFYFTLPKQRPKEESASAA